MSTVMPPRWAEIILRTQLPPRDRQTVSGDLLEEYRLSVEPARGEARADLWYVMQVAGFVWRRAWVWAALLGGAIVARTALDWLVPTTDFYARAAATTAVVAGVFLCAGFWAAWRSHSPSAGAVAGVATAVIAAVISVSGAALLLTLQHDPATLAAAEVSGGLAESFSLPMLLVIPGALLGVVGGALGGVVRRLAPL